MSYNLDQLTADEIDYIVDYISQVGISHFENEVFGDTSQIGVYRDSSTASRSLVSKYVTFPYSGTQRYTNSEYVLISLGDGHTMEYTEDIAITVTCSGGLVTGIKTYSFNVGSLPSYGSYTIENMNNSYSSNSAGLSVTYTITKTISAPLGELSFPIAEYSTMTSASLLLLRAS